MPLRVDENLRSDEWYSAPRLKIRMECAERSSDVRARRLSPSTGAERTAAIPRTACGDDGNWIGKYE